jgi:hypothetical protein
MYRERSPLGRAIWGLVVVCAVAAALRAIGLAYGLPDVLNPDETPILNRALAFAKGSLNPHNFLYPTLYFYVLFVWEGLFFVAGRAFGWYRSIGEFERAFFVDPSQLVLAGRVLTALFGVATVVAVYRLGSRLYDRAIGFGAAWLLAVAPFAVRDAHYIKQDVPVTFFVVLAQLAVARLVVDPAAAARTSPWLAAGALVGLALSTHYDAFPVVVPIIVAGIIEGFRTGRWTNAFTRLVWAGAASIVAFLATSPFFLVDLNEVTRDMVAVRQIDMDRAVVGGGAFSSLAPYVRMLATDAIGWPTFAAAVVGFVLAMARDRRRGLFLASFPAAYLLFLANTTLMSRYANAMLPSLALAAAFALAELTSRLSHRATIAFAVSVAVVSMPGAIGSLRADAFYRADDTRTLARHYIETHVATGATVLVQPHGVQLSASREAILEALRQHLGSESLASIKFQKQLEAAGTKTPAYRVLYLGKTTDGGVDVDKIYVAPEAIGGAAGLSALRDLRVAYVAMNRYNSPDSILGSVRAALQQEGQLVATFSPYREDVAPDRRAAVAPFFHNTADRIDPALERPGPVVEIWRID